MQPKYKSSQYVYVCVEKDGFWYSQGFRIDTIRIDPVSCSFEYDLLFDQVEWRKEHEIFPTQESCFEFILANKCPGNSGVKK